MSVVSVQKKPGGSATWVTIERPEAMNALSGEVLHAMNEAVTELALDPEVRAVVFTGAGDRAFCAGADLKERRGMSDADTQRRIDLINEVFDRIARLPKPTIAAVNGFAFGGGLELALACDFRIAADSAKLGLTEVRLGILPGAGGTQRLPRVIGVARAKELIMLGRRIDANRALAIGLVGEVVPQSELAVAAENIAKELEGCGPIGVAQAKAAIDRGSDVVFEEGRRIERACYEMTLGTEDRAEGLRAFANKRTPQYKGR